MAAIAARPVYACASAGDNTGAKANTLKTRDIRIIPLRRLLRSRFVNTGVRRRGKPRNSAGKPESESALADRRRLSSSERNPLPSTTFYQQTVSFPALPSPPPPRRKGTAIRSTEAEGSCGRTTMFYGNLAPYQRKFFGRDARFATGSLIFDLHRHARKAMGRESIEPHKTRLFPTD
jgi:hypothetical protein